MGIEKKLESTKGKASYVVKSKSKSSSRKDRRRRRKMPAVQRLYDICKEVFSDGEPSIVPSADDIDHLTSVLDGVNALDVGLNPLMPYFRVNSADQPPIITYIPIYECDKFSICIFCLPPSAVIPLHNHPGMTVLSKLLFGTMHIKSYDWATDSLSEMERLPEGARLAKVKVDSEFTAPCSTKVLFPADGGNMHCFTALTPCAVLDVLGPPYSDPEGRHCNYFYDFPFSHFSGEGLSVAEEQGQYAWLKERENPEELKVFGVRYCGPKIISK